MSSLRDRSRRGSLRNTADVDHYLCQYGGDIRRQPSARALGRGRSGGRGFGGLRVRAAAAQPHDPAQE